MARAADTTTSVGDGDAANPHEGAPPLVARDPHEGGATHPRRPSSAPVAHLRDAAPADPPLLPKEVGVSIALERYTVAMSLTAFLVILAAALAYQGAASGDSFVEFCVAAGASLVAAATTFVVARRRLRARLEAYGKQRGLAARAARKTAHEEMKALLRQSGRRS